MKWRSTLAAQSERTIMLGTILIASAISAATAYFLTVVYSVDVLSSLLYPPEDCWLDWGINIGRHCFSDYAMVVGAGISANPWENTINLPPSYQPITVGYPAAGWIPQMLFGLPAHLLGVPRLGLVGYLTALTIAVLSPAIWAARGSRGLEKVVVFVALGAAAIPVWAVIDRGNSAGFVVPIALAFFVALSRQRWGLVTIMVILAAMVKPQFAVLAITLLAARQWKWGGIAIGGIAISNIAAFLLWPRDFPNTIGQSIDNIVKFNSSFGGLTSTQNVSFGRALLLFPDTVKASQGGGISADFLAGPRSLIGYVVLVLVVVAVLALGRRIPPVKVGIVLLATATLFPSFAAFYYVVFVLPIAAIVVRDPNGPAGAGIFDQLAAQGDRRRAVGIWVGLASAMGIAQIAVVNQPVEVPLFGQFGAQGQIATTLLVPTTVALTGFMWLAVCIAIIVSYTRRPAPVGSSEPRSFDGDTTRPEDALPSPVDPRPEPLQTPSPSENATRTA